MYGTISYLFHKFENMTVERSIQFPRQRPRTIDKCGAKILISSCLQTVKTVGFKRINNTEHECVY